VAVLLAYTADLVQVVLVGQSVKLSDMFENFARPFFLSTVLSYMKVEFPAIDEFESILLNTYSCRTRFKGQL